MSGLIPALIAALLVLAGLLLAHTHGTLAARAAGWPGADAQWAAELHRYNAERRAGPLRPNRVGWPAKAAS